MCTSGGVANGVVYTAPPYMAIIEQPIERCRFRYKAETAVHGGTIKGSGVKKTVRQPRVMVG